MWHVNNSLTSHHCDHLLTVKLLWLVMYKNEAIPRVLMVCDTLYRHKGGTLSYWRCVGKTLFVHFVLYRKTSGCVDFSRTAFQFLFCLKQLFLSVLGPEVDPAFTLVTLWS